MVALLAAAVALAAPDAAALTASWEGWRTTLDASARYPFRFTADEWARVARGDVMKRRERLDGTDRVLGVVWVDAPPDRTWIAIHDPHGQYVDDVVHEELPGSTESDRILYQRIDLPWPLTPRQWVIRVRNNLGLIAATRGAVWERTWELSDQRGAAAELPHAVWLPVNEGGWFLVDAAGGTLLGYHVRTAVGGIVPDEAALRWSFAAMD
ncbi:MAG: hypothetical protein ABMB14_34395, partial [Myxococcota bacterium]